jgi:cellulose biosynthesis protein BcsQ
MKTIGVLARKGGAGKSTLTLHWAVEAERLGKGRSAVIDIDPQQTSVKWSKRRIQLGKQTPVMGYVRGTCKNRSQGVRWLKNNRL